MEYTQSIGRQCSWISFEVIHQAVNDSLVPFKHCEVESEIASMRLLISD